MLITMEMMSTKRAQSVDGKNTIGENEAMTVKAADNARLMTVTSLQLRLICKRYYTLLMLKKDRFTTEGSLQFTTLQFMMV